jgi:hypothetical protein
MAWLMRLKGTPNRFKPLLEGLTHADVQFILIGGVTDNE